MIKNIVFDLGGVLINYNPREYLKYMGFNSEKTELYYKIIFCGDEWGKYNASLYDVNMLVAELIKRYEQYKDDIIAIFKNIDYSYILFEIKDTADYLISLKKLGYNIYILSDLSADSYNFNKNFKFFNYIDGGIYSFEVGSTKPDDNNYISLINKYKLIPEETIFIDDAEKNVIAANKFGICGIKFTTLDSLKEEIDKKIKE